MEDKLIKLAADKGAGKIGAIDIADIPFAPSLRSLCEMNTCGNFGKNWCCPPLVGDVDDCIATLKTYSRLVLFQCVYELEDSFDIEGMSRGKKEFERLLLAIHKELPENTLLLGAGGCVICERCAAADDKPCRFPEKQIPSLEAYGIQVSTLAEKCSMKYINGANTVTYFGGIAFGDVKNVQIVQNKKL